MDFAYKSILEIKELIDSGKTTSREVWEYFVDRAQDLDTKIDSFNSFHED